MLLLAGNKLVVNQASLHVLEKCRTRRVVKQSKGKRVSCLCSQGVRDESQLRLGTGFTEQKVILRPDLDLT